MKRFLLICYYWPPVGGAGVQRWLKMTKYLPDLGWTPVIYTPDFSESMEKDESLLKELHPDLTEIRQPIWEPYDVYKRFTGKKKSEKVYSGFIQEGKKPSLTHQLSVFIRGNFFIPDARRFWIKPSISFLKKYLKENPVDVIISTGPPHSMHMIAMGVKKHFPEIPWIADFRDPWTEIDFYHHLKLTKWADRKHRKLERMVLEQADEIVTVSPTWVKDFKRLSGGREVSLVYNGYDTADVNAAPSALDEEFSIVHVGSMNPDRNPKALWKALGDMVKQNMEFSNKLRIRLIGQVDASIVGSILENGLEENLEKRDFIPHGEVMSLLQRSQLLLLPINNVPHANGMLPIKLYEYLGASRPIFAIGPKESDAQLIIKEAGAGYYFHYDDSTEIRNAITQVFTDYQSGKLQVNPRGVERFSRKKLAGDYAEILKKITVTP